MKENKSELITQSTVMEMGFTKAMIKNLLPKPIKKTKSDLLLCCTYEIMGERCSSPNNGN